MIKRSKQFDLGLDTTRMKDPKDGQRQSKTVDEILDRFFKSPKDRRWDVQILADEVGMGKTFVGLGVAYSVLEHMMSAATEPDLKKCYQKVLVITPNNSALYAKWQREVSEFVKRCVLPQHREEAGRWFAPTAVNRMDELSAELRRPRHTSKVIVTSMSMFSGGKLRNYDLKRRYLLGHLFTYWGNRFKVEQRERLLRGAPDSWPTEPYHLTDLDEREYEQIPFDGDEIRTALKRIEGKDDPDWGLMEEILEICRELSEKFVRYRKARFSEIEEELTKLYKRITTELIRSAFPLVIVDEAHNWKNHRNGYDRFMDVIAPRTRRSLLLTATPFQLHPDEMLKVLEISDHMSPCPTIEESEIRQNRMKGQREEVIRPVLKKSAVASSRFTEAWMHLPRKLSSHTLSFVLNCPFK